jgi:hypothetical protein
MRDATGSQPPKLLDEVREVFHLHHYFIPAERCSVKFWGLRSTLDGGQTWLRHPSPQRGIKPAHFPS